MCIYAYIFAKGMCKCVQLRMSYLPTLYAPPTRAFLLMYYDEAYMTSSQHPQGHMHTTLNSYSVNIIDRSPLLCFLLFNSDGEDYLFTFFVILKAKCRCYHI